jgi:hypothetical protein
MAPTRKDIAKSRDRISRYGLRTFLGSIGIEIMGDHLELEIPSSPLYGHSDGVGVGQKSRWS